MNQDAHITGHPGVHTSIASAAVPERFNNMLRESRQHKLVMAKAGAGMSSLTVPPRAAGVATGLLAGLLTRI